MGNFVEHMVCGSDLIAFGVEFYEVVTEKCVGEKSETEDSSVDDFGGR